MTGQKRLSFSKPQKSRQINFIAEIGNFIEQQSLRNKQIEFLSFVRWKTDIR